MAYWIGRAAECVKNEHRVAPYLNRPDRGRPDKGGPAGGGRPGVRADLRGAGSDLAAAREREAGLSSAQLRARELLRTKSRTQKLRHAVERRPRSIAFPVKTMTEHVAPDPRVHARRQHPILERVSQAVGAVVGSLQQARAPQILVDVVAERVADDSRYRGTPRGIPGSPQGSPRRAGSRAGHAGSTSCRPSGSIEICGTLESSRMVAAVSAASSDGRAPSVHHHEKNGPRFGDSARPAPRGKQSVAYPVVGTAAGCALHLP